MMMEERKSDRGIYPYTVIVTDRNGETARSFRPYDHFVRSYTILRIKNSFIFAKS